MNTMMSDCFIFGNGRSRDGMISKILSVFGAKTPTTFGCNFITNEFIPNYVCIVDDRVADAVVPRPVTSGIKNVPKFKTRYGLVANPFATPGPSFIVAEDDDKYESHEYWNHVWRDVKQLRPHNNAGMFAMEKAINLNFNRLFCFGFDFLVRNNDQKMSNIYKDHPMYQTGGATVDDCLRRIAYFEWFANYYPHVEFRFIFPDDFKRNDFHAIKASNVKGQFFSRFLEEVQPHATQSEHP